MSKNQDIVVDEIEVKSSIEDVAYWFLLQEGMSNKKMQKLCYYAQAFSLVLLDKPIATNADFEEWVHGPVNRRLWDAFKQYGWTTFRLKDEAREKTEKRAKEVFREEQINVLQATWDTFGEFSADELESLTHKEKPWQEQRQGFDDFENCNNVISEETMKDFYKGKISNEQAL